MPYQDVSPKNQHFMNFSRPLTLNCQFNPADKLPAIMTLIYGFGEYRLQIADFPRFLQALNKLQQQLDEGAEFGEVCFFNAAENNILHDKQILLQVKGEGEAMTFYLSIHHQDNKQSTDAPWLIGETTRSHLIEIIDIFNRKANQ